MTTACASGSPEARPHGSRPKPVERERELAVLGELARRTAAGAPALVILEGPDGIGKTTLLCALAAQARSWICASCGPGPGGRGIACP